MKRIALLALALAATAGAANAGPYESSYWRERRIDAREARQADRIYHARRRGELTWLEAFRLRQEQAHIRRLEAAAKADGYVSPHEARRIERAQDRASYDIYDQAHDGQRAWWRRWH
jgi:uncharacterized membrane protein YebE (DUF533 family)